MATHVTFRFYATIEERADRKTNVYKLKWIQPADTELQYEFPTELQSPSVHSEICTLPKVKTVLASMKTRGAYRTFKIALPPEIASLYMDEDGDIRYKGVYLQSMEATQGNEKITREHSTTQTKTEISNAKKNLKKIHEDFVLKNFDGKSSPIDNWLYRFEKKCESHFFSKSRQMKIEY